MAGEEGVIAELAQSAVAENGGENSREELGQQADDAAVEKEANGAEGKDTVMEDASDAAKGGAHPADAADAAKQGDRKRSSDDRERKESRVERRDDAGACPAIMRHGNVTACSSTAVANRLCTCRVRRVIQSCSASALAAGTGSEASPPGT